MLRKDLVIVEEHHKPKGKKNQDRGRLIDRPRSTSRKENRLRGQAAAPASMVFCG